MPSRSPRNDDLIMSSAELRAAMELLGLNNIALAKMLGIVVDTVSAWRSDGPRSRPVRPWAVAYLNLLLHQHEREQMVEERIREKILAMIDPPPSESRG